MKSGIAAFGLLLSATAVPACAAEPVANFKDWAASSYRQHGHRICYSFTEAVVGPGVKGGCNTAVLVVTHAPPHHDRVVVSPCHAYAPSQSALTMSVQHTGFGFHPHGKYAYADAPAAAVAAFRRGTTATIPAPIGHPAELFSLRGFTAAYDAMRKICIG